MAGYQHIVFATDLTDAAVTAARRVVDQHACGGGRVTLLHVIEHFPDDAANVPAGEDPEAYVRERATGKLAEFAQRTGLEAADRELILTTLSARQVIIDYLRKHEPDLVVMGAIGHPGALGTTVDGVAAYSPCDVLVVQGGAWAPT